MSLGPTVEGFLDYCRDVKKLSHGTVKDMKCSINRLCVYIKEVSIKKECWELTLPEYIRWINRCREIGHTPKHINKNLSHIRSLIDYAWRLEKVDRNVLEGYFLKDSEQRKEVEVLTVEEARQLVNAFSVNSRDERRNRLIVLLLYGCGLRSGELCGLDVQDFDQERCEIKVTGKGKERVIPVMDGIYTEILAYLHDRRATKGPMFKTLIKKTRVRITDVIDIVDEATRRAGLNKRPTPKSIRHTFASHLADRGVDVAVISKLMGHRSPRETSVYLHASKDRLDKTVFESMSKKEEK